MLTYRVAHEPLHDLRNIVLANGYYMTLQIKYALPIVPSYLMKNKEDDNYVGKAVF